ncbi:hypothetical protein PDIDSM_2121 [Penicillium digitatum]|nr:hypothetical protein PDIDSM_2121 [Penicillium digitatum]
MVTSEGPKATKALTFSSLRHNFTSLAQRDGFKDQLRVHGIRGGIANKIDPKASQATRGQALDHQNHDTYLKYQSSLKALDIQALFYDLEPDYECRDMEQSMSHHRDSNVPLQLNAATIEKIQTDDEIVKMNQRIAHMTQEIAGGLEENRDLVFERARLYSKKAKRLLAWKKDFVEPSNHTRHALAAPSAPDNSLLPGGSFEIMPKVSKTRTRPLAVFERVPMRPLREGTPDLGVPKQGDAEIKCANCGAGHRPTSDACEVKAAAKEEARLALANSPLYHRVPLHFRQKEATKGNATFQPQGANQGLNTSTHAAKSRARFANQIENVGGQRPADYPESAITASQSARSLRSQNQALARFIPNPERRPQQQATHKKRRITEPADVMEEDQEWEQQAVNCDTAETETDTNLTILS